MFTMPNDCISSREFNQDISRAKREAANGPVFITDRGKPAHVLLSMADYERLIQPKQSLADALACPEAAAIEFDAPRFAPSWRSVDFD
jgi:prevent-host-death family protein